MCDFVFSLAAENLTSGCNFEQEVVFFTMFYYHVVTL